MISFDEFKEICLKWGLLPATFGGYYKPDETIEYKLPIGNGLNRNNYGDLVVAHYDKRWGVRIMLDLEMINWGVWHITKQQAENAMGELFKQIKNFKLKQKLEKMEKDFV
jgi:hypothetical protein